LLLRENSLVPLQLLIAIGQASGRLRLNGRVAVNESAKMADGKAHAFDEENRR